MHLTVNYTWNLKNALTCAGRSSVESSLWKMSLETPQPVVAHQVAKFSCCGQYFMSGPANHGSIKMVVFNITARHHLHDN